MRITVDVTLKELNDLEDYLTADLIRKEEKQMRGKCLNIWNKLCDAYDRAKLAKGK